MIIENERYKLYLGDCLEVMDELIKKGVKFDAIITDPPYQTTKCKWDNIIPFEPMWERLNKLIKPNGAIVLFGSEPFSSALRISNIKNYKYDWYWDKVRGVGHLNSKKQPMKNIETISVFNEKGNYNPQMRDREKPRKSRNNNTQKIFGNCKDNFEGDTLDKKYPIHLIQFSKSSKADMKFHSSQKPVKLLEYLIKTYTNENDLILDFTAGSFSTGVACMNTNRRFMGCELDEEYFEIGKKRMEEANE